MKKILFFLLLFAGIVNAQIINIPDANFKSFLLGSSSTNNIAYGGGNYIAIDANANGEIELTEAVAVTELQVNNNLLPPISSINGLQFFTSLTSLTVSGTVITALDLAPLTQLTTLVVLGNASLTSLNMTNLPDLQIVNCQMNPQLTDLPLNGLPLLQSLLCQNNSLTSLNVNICPNLQNLGCYSNAIATLDASGLSQLLLFSCDSNPLSTINVTGCTALQHLVCNNTVLTSVDVTSCINLIDLGVSNCSALETILAKNGANEAISLDQFTTALDFICVDEVQVDGIRNDLTTYLLNAVCSSYCSFTPGGDYNTISGIVRYDINNNGCDAADITATNVRIDINDGTGTGASFVDNSGNYIFYTEAGSFDITPSVENPSFFNFSPATATIPFADDNNNTVIQDFCITANGVHSDVEVVISPVIRARPGFDATYSIVYRNKGNQVQSQANGITLSYNSNQMDFDSSTLAPSVNNPGSLAWDYSDLMPFESRQFEVRMHIHAPTDAGPVNVGDVLQFNSIILPSDENPADNSFQFNQTVVGSYDPNSISCIEGPSVPPSEIGNYLHYAVNFENTGSDVAENVVVRIEMDPAQFNIGSLQLMWASHPVEAKITGNTAEFVFKNIYLPIGGHGHILLKIRTDNALAPGAMVSKRADIFFDYNAPIDTGMANTTFQLLNTKDFAEDSSVAIFPNPTAGAFTVKAASAIKTIDIYDVQGRLLQFWQRE